MRPIFALIAIAAVIVTPALAAPATLECVSEGSVNWHNETPTLVAMVESGDTIGGPPIIHLHPASGEWYLEVPGSRALTNDGGTFGVVRTSEFTAYYHEWVGIEDDTMLRIRGGGETPLRFLFVSDDSGAFVGSCIEPSERFIFLREPGHG